MRWWGMVLCCLSLAACREVEFYSALTQPEANEIVVLLSQNQVPAQIVKTVKQNQATFGVSVAAGDVDRARGLLQEHNLPRPLQPGLKEIFKEAGFIPTPQEQKARMLLALKGEIINSLQRIPDVVEADALINVPTPGEAADTTMLKPTASIVLKVRPSEQAMSTLTESKIQSFVANAVEKLDPRDVTVIITYIGTIPSHAMVPGQTVVTMPSRPDNGVESASGADGDVVVTFAGVAVQAESVGRLKWYLGIFLGLLALVSLGLVVMVIQTSRLRQQREGDQTLLPPNDFPPQLQAGGDE